jgi:hypothetical protein
MVSRFQQFKFADFAMAAQMKALVPWAKLCAHVGAVLMPGNFIQGIASKLARPDFKP